VYDTCIESFSALPLSGLLDGIFFCVHGGISPELNTVSDINRVCTNSKKDSPLALIFTGQINRFQEPGSYGLLCDLLWADPVPNFGHRGRAFPESVPRTAWSNVGAQYHTRLLLLFHVKLSIFLSQRSFLIRSCRYEAVVKFLERNELLGVIRGHEVQDSG
jgi:serine/threonine-protein phosphatase 2B catalytic subunit